MTRDTLKVRIQLERILCHEEGDGFGPAEPYLWPVFFKIDGDGVVLGPDLKLAGTATVPTRFGSHGNLGGTGVGDKEEVEIPEQLGAWDPVLRPIPVDPSLGFGDDVGGVVGVAAMLMEEDNSSDAAAVAGYQTLLGAIKTSLDMVIPSLAFGNPDIAEEDQNSIKDAAASAIQYAIGKTRNFIGNLWQGINPDQEIGALVALFHFDDLFSAPPSPIRQRWQNEGDWEIVGHVVGTVPCPAEGSDQLKGEIGAIFAGDDMDRMRGFRDRELRAAPGAALWWGLAERNAPALIRLFQTDREAASALTQLGPSAARLLGEPEAPIPDALIAHARTILKRAARSASRRLRIDSGRALSLLELAPGRSVGEALKIADAIPPARRVDRALIDRLRSGTHGGTL
ncbi:MAG TPA: hypothetical protein VN231_10335 [Allosphingosinicella sp.]|nr:hypothetical protein [Allosphingosinicella sp.]